MRRTLPLLTVLAVVALSACRDRDPAAPERTPPATTSVIFQVNGYLFLPPIGTAAETDAFLGGLLPVVTVCKWDDATKSCISNTTVATFTRTGGTGGAELRLSADNIYHVEWDTGASTGIEDGVVYQIVVQLDQRLLGTADIAIYRNMGQAKNAGGDAFALKDGRTLPIRFGIRPEALLEIVGAGGSQDFVIATISTDGGTQTVTTPSGDAAFRVDGGNVQVPGGGTQFTLLIAEKELDPATGKCETGYAGPNTGGCYLFETFPATVTFLDGNGNPAGMAGVCPDANATAAYRLAKYDDGTTTFPDPGPSIAACDPQALERLPAFLRTLARLILPTPLYAKDEGETGMVGSFSTLFWAVPVALQENPAQTFPPGGYVPGDQITLSFRLISEHCQRDSGCGAADLVVTEPLTVDFAVSGGSLVTPASVTTAGGIASVTWQLPAAGGSYTLDATVPGPVDESGDPTTFRFTASVVANAEMIVWNDVNTFDAISMAHAGNVALVESLVGFSGAGSRASGTGVLIDRGRFATGQAEVGAAFEAAITAAGYSITTITSSAASAPITSIDPSVRVVFLVGPTEAFGVAEVNTLKRFAAQGGRIVFIGEHSGFAPATLQVQNQLLADFSTGASNIGGALDCITRRTATPPQLGSHQVTSGSASVQYVCMSAMSLGANDVALLYDDGVADPEDLAQPAGFSATNPCAGACVLAAAVRITTAPLSAPVLAGASALRMSASTESSEYDSAGRRR